MNYWHISDSPDIVSVLLRTFHGKAFIDYSALKLNLAEKIRLKKEEKNKETIGRLKIGSSAEFSTLSEKGEADIASCNRWMEVNWCLVLKKVDPKFLLPKRKTMIKIISYE